jgi:hypothetical protein
MPRSKVARYRMDVFRGGRSTLRLVSDDPRTLADEYEALSRVAPPRWRIEIRDMLRGTAGHIVTYEELRRRPGRARHGDYVSVAAQRAESRDRTLALAIAHWAESPDAPQPMTRAAHDWRRVRQHAYEYVRDHGVFGPALDRALDRVALAIRRLR